MEILGAGGDDENAYIMAVKNILTSPLQKEMTKNGVVLLHGGLGEASNEDEGAVAAMDCFWTKAFGR